VSKKVPERLSDFDAGKDGFFMSGAQSTSDAFLLAVPLVIFLFVALFRLDELMCKPRKLPKPGRRLTDWDENGVPICTDPARTVHTISRRTYGVG
jgi:hypothetical protein